MSKARVKHIIPNQPYAEIRGGVPVDDVPGVTMGTNRRRTWKPNVKDHPSQIPKRRPDEDE